VNPDPHCWIGELRPAVLPGIRSRDANEDQFVLEKDMTALETGRVSETGACVLSAPTIGIYKIWFRFKDFLWESIIRLLPPHMQSLQECNAIAGLLRNIRPLPRPTVCMPNTIQYWQWQYRVKDKPERGGSGWWSSPLGTRSRDANEDEFA